MTLHESFSFLTLLFLTSQGIRCRRQTPSFELTRNDVTYIDYDGISWNALFDCGLFTTRNWACESTLWEGSFTRTRTNSEGTEVTSDWSYSTETKGCAYDSVCESLVGSTDACQYAEYTYERWLPTSCDASNDYDAYTEDYNVKMSLSCCSDDDLCNTDEDYTSCTENSDFSNYLDELNSCWNNFKKSFMEELLCDEEDDDIFTWAYNCTNEDGTWNSDYYTAPECRYRATCTTDLQDMLAEYGECACSAATDNDYSGDFIATAMEAAWYRWCPGIELSCQTGDVAATIYKYYVINYNIIMAIGVDTFTEEIKNTIINAVADYLNVHNNSITVYQDTTSRRRLQDDEVSVTVEVTASTDTDRDVIEDDIGSGTDDAVESATGYTVTDSEKSTEERNSTSTSSTSAGHKQVDLSNFVLLVTFISVFAAFIQ